MNGGYREENPVCCYFHPKEALIGVCPLCLKERLLILAAKQSQGHHLYSARETWTSQDANNIITSSHHRRPSINLPKIFGFGSFLNEHWKSDISDDHYDFSTSSQEDSFISIKFEGNGVASWDMGTVSMVSLDFFNNSCINHSSNKESKQLPEKITKDTVSVIEHAKPRASLRWRKWIGHLYQLIRWNKDYDPVGTKLRESKLGEAG